MSYQGHLHIHSCISHPAELLLPFGREISLPVIREDSLSDPFFPFTDESSLVVSSSSAGIAISFPFWPIHQMADSYRSQGAEEQTRLLETRRLGSAWGLVVGLTAVGPGPHLLLSSACQPMREDWKSHQQASGQGPAWTWVATNTGSPNKWLYTMWSLSHELRGRANGT